MSRVRPDSTQNAPVVRAIRSIFTQVIIDIPLNPPEIVTIDGEEFKINTTNMKPLRPYMMEFTDSRYLIWKAKDKALVIEEV